MLVMVSEIKDADAILLRVMTEGWSVRGSIFHTRARLLRRVFLLFAINIARN